MTVISDGKLMKMEKGEKSNYSKMIGKIEQTKKSARPATHSPLQSA